MRISGLVLGLQFLSIGKCVLLFWDQSLLWLSMDSLLTSEDLGQLGVG